MAQAQASYVVGSPVPLPYMNASVVVTLASLFFTTCFSGLIPRTRVPLSKIIVRYGHNADFESTQQQNSCVRCDITEISQP